MIRLLLTLGIVLAAFSSTARADDGQNPAAALYDINNSGTVNWDDVMLVYNDYRFGFFHIDSDVNNNNYVDYYDVLETYYYLLEYDTNNDYQVDSDDAQTIINFLNAGGGGYLPGHPFDINDDNYVSAIDSLWIINSIGAKAWQNPDNPLDVSGDGHYTALDLLLIGSNYIYKLNQPLPGNTRKCVAPFLDPNGDNHYTASDILLLINNPPN